MKEKLNKKLIKVSKEGDPHKVNSLLSRGAEANNQNGLPLYWASLIGSLETVELLLKWGADPNKRDGGALCVAVDYNYIDVARLLLKWGADPNCTRDGVILNAYLWGHWQMVECLLKSGSFITNELIEKEQKNVKLETLFTCVLKCKDEENLFKHNWPQWFMSKYKDEIKQINDRLIE